MRKWLTGLILLLLMMTPAVAGGDVPDATIELSGGSVAAGVGYTWGRGTLIYQGRLFRVKVNGLSIADVGISNYTASGNVYNLKKPADILGTYTAFSAGGTVGHGYTGTSMQNQHGVIINMTAMRAGLSLTLAPGGMTISAAR